MLNYWMLAQEWSQAVSHSLEPNQFVPGVRRMMKRPASNMHPALSGVRIWGRLPFEDGMNGLNRSSLGPASSLQVLSSRV